MVFVPPRGESSFARRLFLQDEGHRNACPLGCPVEGIAEKTEAYLEAGVPLVWEVNPFPEVMAAAYRPGLPPEHFNVTQDLTAEPHLPGFRVPVANVFAR